MKERTLPNLSTGDIEFCGDDPVCSQGKQWWEADFPKRKTHSRRTATPKERGSLRHPCGRGSAVLWTLLTGWATVRMLKSARGMWQSYLPGAHDNSKCQGHEFSFKIVRPCHQCWICQSGLISSSFIATTPLPIRVWALCFDYTYDFLHLTCHLL